MKSNLSKVLYRIVPHFTIILAVLCFLLFAIDRFNSNMMFLANDLTKWILAVLCICSVYCSVLLIGERFRQPARRHVRDDGAVTIAPDEEDAVDVSVRTTASDTADKPEA